jgi:toxin ParE1/3/4
MRKAFLHRKAEEDAREIALSIAEDNPEAADAFRVALERIREMLADLPEIGSIRSFHNKELAGLRMLRIPKFEKYLIFYRPVPEGTEIIRVLHGARDIPSLFGQTAAGSGEEQKAA